MMYLQLSISIHKVSFKTDNAINIFRLTALGTDYFELRPAIRTRPRFGLNRIKKSAFAAMKC